MAKFVYRLQNVLDVKYRLESLEKTAYAQAAARLAEEESKFQELLTRQNTYRAELKEASNGVLDIKHIQHLSDSMEVMKGLIQKQFLNVNIAQKNLEAARTRLNKAMQERKIYEKLKEKAFENFKTELADQEKKEIDELVSFTYNDANSEESD